jgi:hypothetical protein
MPESKAIFVNEEAVRLLNYLITNKEIISRNENHSGNPITIEALPKSEEILIK